MSSFELSIGKDTDVLQAAVSSPNKMTYKSGQELADSSAGPPYGLNNFPFTFDEHSDDASRSVRIEADVRAPISQQSEYHNIMSANRPKVRPFYILKL
jgi:hypothetical protein